MNLNWWVNPLKLTQEFFFLCDFHLFIHFWFYLWHLMGERNSTHFSFMQFFKFESKRYVRRLARVRRINSQLWLSTFKWVERTYTLLTRRLLLFPMYHLSKSPRWSRGASGGSPKLIICIHIFDENGESLLRSLDYYF